MDIRPDKSASTRAAISPSRHALASAFFSLAICAFLSFIYARRPDSWAALTIFPAWLWPISALLLHGAPRVLAVFARLFSRRATAETASIKNAKSDARANIPQRNRGARVLAPRLFISSPIVAWIFFALIFCDEPRGALRLLTRAPLPAKPAPQTLRVVSMNCAGGDANAMREVATFSPDVILLQESPPRAAVAKFARQLYGANCGLVYGLDSSILTRGKVEELPLPPKERAHFVAARVTFSGGETVNLVSLRLVPAVFQVDFWNVSTRAAQTENRRARRAMLRNIVQRISSFASTRATILGGDFNAPQRDAVFRELSPQFYEAFAESGRGFGNTITNDFPVVRIDQIWLRGADALAVETRRTQFPDHRLVICDVMLQEN